MIFWTQRLKDTKEINKELGANVIKIKKYIVISRSVAMRLK